MFVGESVRFNYTGNVQEIKLSPGVYKIDLYGASGGIGCGNINPVGKGGFVSGYVAVSPAPPPRFYIYVGQHGVDNWQTSTRFNGGGPAVALNNHNGGAGGGATDIRIRYGTWNDIDSLKSRILVAGGGGGAQSNCGGYATEGHGGNLVGGTSYNLNYQNRPQSEAMTRAYSTGGTQKKAGNGYNINDIGLVAYGGFGYGATSVTCGSGGGGGYYGGGGGYTSGGGGGSSYAAGYPDCDTTYLSYQGDFKFENVVFKQGINIGHGYAIITMIEETYIRKNTNLYKNNRFQNYFDFNKLI